MYCSRDQDKDKESQEKQGQGMLRKESSKEASIRRGGTGWFGKSRPPTHRWGGASGAGAMVRKSGVCGRRSGTPRSIVTDRRRRYRARPSTR